MPDLDERLEQAMGQLVEPVDTDGAFERIQARMTRLRRRRHRRIAAGLVAAAAALTVGSIQLVRLGGDDGRIRTAEPRPPATSAPPSSLSVVPPPPATSPVFRFDPVIGTCSPSPDPVIDRTWQVSAPRSQGPATGVITIGLRNKMAPDNVPGSSPDPQVLLPAPDTALHAQVIAPDGATYTSRDLRLLPSPPDRWIDIGYPTDFPNAPSLEPGTYTILWTTPLGPIACDGLVIG